jgi:hypothetical protein
MRGRAALAVLLASTCGLASAHRAPNSFVRLEFAAHAVRVEMLVPQSELAFAMPGAGGPEAFADYLSRHVAVETPDGMPWTMHIGEVRGVRYLDHDYQSVNLEITPPAGAPAQEFVLVDDAVTHEVRNHVVIVTKRGTADQLLGTLQYPVRRLPITWRKAPN